jgi:2-polyprenyl-3-methyl-5-hydroxy-6-metoxy-1,4-benzoquinol methylase
MLSKNKDIKIIDLGFHPYADTFINKKQLNYSEPVFQLSCFLNKNTGVIRNAIKTDDASRYNLYDYSYTSSNSFYSKNYWKKYSNDMKQELNITNNFKILEIGSNDGYLLQSLKKYTNKIWGVDASKLMCKIARGKKIKTFNLIFNLKNSKIIKDKVGKVDVIISNNVLNHSNDVINFILGVKNLLNKNGTFVFELPYWYNLVLHQQFDQIYHEHVYYFTVKSSEFFLRKCGLQIIHIKETEYHGGCIRIYAKIKSNAKKNLLIKKYINKENKLGLFKEKTYKKIMKNLYKKKLFFLEKIINFKKKKYTIVGIGAPAKGNTFLNFLKLDKDFIDFITDGSKFKINKYTPLSRIPIVPDDYLKKIKDKICVIFLSWNLEKILKPKILKYNKKIKFISFF